MKDIAIALVALTISVGLLWAGLAPDKPTVFAFPNFWAWVLLSLSLGLLVQALARRAVRGADARDVAAVTDSLTQLAPLVVIGFGYFMLFPVLGFYASALLAFALVSMFYDSLGVAARPLLHGAVSLVFTLILYLIFGVLLGVQVPGGWLF
ncbi:tripartite tricarboxylate transporter TctB family protein [Alloalcanivorax sp. C16-2]|uniref:tripartite tricarboxylate transporter TctB family protein n=1 Tax=Alloalcanivorax sp. C16-2 TaxID=3390052 RepID=UPI003970B56F